MVKFYSGYGATEKDLERGFVDIEDQWAPEQDVENYKDWYTRSPREDLDFPIGFGGEAQVPSKLQREWEFKDKNRETKGLLTRNPRERY